MIMSGKNINTIITALTVIILVLTLYKNMY